MSINLKKIKEKLRFIKKWGVGEYLRSGQQIFSGLNAYLEEANRLELDVGEIHFDVRAGDNSSEHPLRKSVLEASFAAEMVSRAKPETVFDIGSDLVFLATLSSFVNVVGVDTRTIDFRKPGLKFKKIDARGLPFKDNECEFMSSLCVIEHIGLGRYGDTIDPIGDLKFISEVKRCLKPGGIFVFSIPVSASSVLVFNAHRIYNLSQIDKMITGFSLIDERFIRSGFGLLQREEALPFFTNDPKEYMVWIGCVKKSYPETKEVERGK